MGRIEIDGELAILGEHLTKPRAQKAIDAMANRNETALDKNSGSLFVGALGQDFDLMCGDGDVYGS